MTHAAPTPMIEYVAPDPAVPELVPPGDDGDFYWFKQACLPQKLVLEELLPPFPAPVLPDADRQRAVEWVQVEKDEEKE